MTPRQRTINALVSALLEWYPVNARDLPWRRKPCAYAVWISEIMLQQTQVKTVLPYWERWMRELPTIPALAAASPEKVHKLWEGLGYYTRVRNLQKAARLILERHAGQFPESFDDILALPGIGRYTAGAICSIAFHQPKPILDGNVIRVLTRVFGIATNPKAKETNARLWHLAEELVLRAAAAPVIGAQRRLESPSASVPLHGNDLTNPGKVGRASSRAFFLEKKQRLARTLSPPDRIDKVDFKSLASSHACSSLNQSLMELGALVCTPRAPRCGLCPVKKLCVAFRENRAGELPHLERRAKTQERHFVAFVVERQGRFLVRQRPAGVVNAHLWEFPNVELSGARFDARAAAREALGFEPERPGKLRTIRHSITRYRIQLQVYAATLNRLTKSAQAKGRWLTPDELRNLSFPSAHKKILARFPVLKDAADTAPSGRVPGR